ncbi:MAG TPA: hypothetical protein VFS49_00075 [Croceibacterium sp.]|nr:hypothetical protein [Croceibacterium sp.]
MTAYLLLFAIVFAVNLMPAFGPPTWSIIVLYGLNSELPVPAIVVVGALAAALGRFCLAHAFRLLRGRVSESTRRNLEAARNALEKNRGRGVLALGLFALSPVPSAQLFEAAGLTGTRLLPFTLAFFAGRLVSYSIYAASAKAVEGLTLGDTFRDALTSPVGIAGQVIMLAALVALAKVDWAKLLSKR